MTQAQMQNLVDQLAAFPNVEFRVSQELRGGAQTYVVHARGANGQKVTSTTLTTIANAVPAVPNPVVASTDEAEFA